MFHFPGLSNVGFLDEELIPDLLEHATPNELARIERDTLTATVRALRIWTYACVPIARFHSLLVTPI